VHGFTRYLRQHHVALLALFVALGGTSYAAIKLPANSVGAKQIKRNAVGSAEVRNGVLKSADFAAGELPGGPVGPAGPAGGVGPQGPPGPQGPKGDPFLPSVVEDTGSSANDSSSPKSTVVSCPEGSLATGGYTITTQDDNAPIVVVSDRERFPAGISEWVVTARESVAYAGTWQIQVFVNCIG